MNPDHHYQKTSLVNFFNAKFLEPSAAKKPLPSQAVTSTVLTPLMQRGKNFSRPTYLDFRQSYSKVARFLGGF
jgi:hypothetical protein